MKRDRLTSAPQGDTSRKLSGGGKFSYSALLRHSLISLSFTILVSFLCLACSEETSRTSYPEMQAYYTESCHLGVAASDSVQRFSQKVDAFVTQYADAKEDPLYPKINANIQAACARLGFLINDDWDGDYNGDF